MVKKIVIPAVVFFVLLALAGMVMEMVSTQSQEHLRYFRTRNVFQYQAGNVKFSPVLGYTTTPNLDVMFNNREFSTKIHTNQLGFRDDAFSITDASVIFLGDSYVWGWGVEEQQDVEKQYEQLTGKNVLNAGVPGYGNVQELLLLYKLQHMTSLEGKHIYLFFCANDLQDNQNTSFGLFPYFKKTNSSYDFSHPNPDGFDQWLTAADKWMVHNEFAKHSILWFYLSATIKNLVAKDIYKDYETTADRLNGIQAFFLVADALHSLQQDAHTQISIVYIPPASYYAQGTVDRSFDIVRSACGKLQLTFLDLGPVLTKDDYYPLDMHWKASGHKKAAMFIASH